MKKKTKKNKKQKKKKTHPDVSIQFKANGLGHIAQLVVYLSQEPEVPVWVPGLATFLVFPADSGRAVVSY